MYKAAGLSVRSIFRLQNSKRCKEVDSFISKLYWANGSGSDLIAILNAYRVSKIKSIFIYIYFYYEVLSKIYIKT